MFDIPKWEDDIPKTNVDFGKGKSGKNVKQKLTNKSTSSATPELPLKINKHNSNQKKIKKNKKNFKNASKEGVNFNKIKVAPFTNENVPLKSIIAKNHDTKKINKKSVIKTNAIQLSKEIVGNESAEVVNKERNKSRKRKLSSTTFEVDSKNAGKEGVNINKINEAPITNERVPQKRVNAKNHNTKKNKKKSVIKTNAIQQSKEIGGNESTEVVNKKRKKSRKRKLQDTSSTFEDDNNLISTQDSSKAKRKKKNSETQDDLPSVEKHENNSEIIKTKIDKKKEKFKMMLQMENNRNHINVSGNNLRQRMLERLKAAQFRFLNEKLYTTSGSEAQKMFQSDPEAFNTYHQGYQQQVKKWPVNPLDLIVKRISKMPKTHIVADMGCGEAALSSRVQQKVHSFDLVATKPEVEACDMAHTPLLAASVDVAVYCLALMGTELTQYLMEANRVLKIGGHLLIAEVESRFDKVDTFSEEVQRLGFKLKNLDKSNKVFFFMEFTKLRDPPAKKSKLPSITLKPCLYKKR